MLAEIARCPGETLKNPAGPDDSRAGEYQGPRDENRLKIAINNKKKKAAEAAFSVSRRDRRGFQIASSSF